MPPKAQQKNRAQLKREAQERAEAERKQRLEQERIEAERQRALEAEQQRLRKIEEARLAKEEAQRLAMEQTDYMDEWHLRLKEKIYHAQKQIKESLEWKKVLDCLPKPDPHNIQDLNTFMSLYTEPQSLNSFNEIQQLFQKIQQCEHTVEGINELTMIARAQNHPEKEQFYKDFVHDLRVSSQEKLELVTGFINQNVDILLDEKQEELLRKMAENQDKKKDDKKMNLELFKIYLTEGNVRFGVWVNPTQKSQFRPFPINFEKLQIQCEVPKPLMSQQMVMKICHTAYDLNPSNPEFHVIGGILDIELYEFLPMPKKAEKFGLKLLYNTKNALKKINYPPMDANGQMNFQNAVPVKVIYNLPAYVYIHPSDQIKVALWDNHKGWLFDNIEDVRFTREKKEIQFSTIRLAPLAFLQPRCIDFPYQSWKIRCNSESSALLDLQTKRVKLQFLMKDRHVQLIGEPLESLEFLYNKAMLPGSLLYALKKSGINLLPDDEDSDRAELLLKDHEVEDHALDDVSLAVRGFFLKSNKWSSQLNQDRVSFFLRENLEYDEEFQEDQEKDWKTVTFWKNKCAMYTQRESDVQLNETLLENTSTHTNLYILLKESSVCLEEATERIKDFQEIVLMDTIKQFMKLARIISFSK